MYSYFEDRELEKVVIYFLKHEPLLYESLSITFDICKSKLLANTKYILGIIQEDYEDAHPFKKDDFIYKPVLYQLAYSKLICEEYLNNEDILEDYLRKKLISNIQGKYNIDLFNRNMSECVFFIYILIGIYIKSDLHYYIKEVEYEPVSSNNKKLEYSFILNDGYNINVEVKTLDCDPFLKDSEIMDSLDLNRRHIYIKKIFKDEDVEETLKDILGDEEKYIELSSNFRQVTKNIKKIRKKFEQKINKDINIGVLVISYGTSREEFFSYLLHEDKGAIKRLDFGNIDNLILFSNTHYSSFMLDEIYRTEHVFSVNMSLNSYSEDIFNKLRLDKYIVKNGICQKKFISFKHNTLGVYTSEVIDTFFTLLPYFVDGEERKKHLSEINNKNECVFNYDIVVCKENGMTMNR